MTPAPKHARRRRIRLLLLISALFAVSAFSPRLRPGFQPAKDEREETFAHGEEIAMRLQLSSQGGPVVRAALAEADPEDLFAYLPEPADAESLEARAPVPAHEIHYVALNPALLQVKENVFWTPHARLQLPLPDGRRVEIEIAHTQALGPDRFTSHGRIVGDEMGRAVFAYYGGRLAARVETKDGTAFELRPVADEGGEIVNQFYEVDDRLVPDCGGQTEPGADAAVIGRIAEASAEDAVTGADTVSGAPANPVIDVLMAYTSAVRSSFGSTELVAIQLDLGIARVNADLEFSAITARVRLAGSIEVNLPNDDAVAAAAGWQSSALTSLRGETDGLLDEVHAKRNSVGADLVCLLVRRSDPDSSGIAYILDKPRGYAAPYFGFSVVNASLVSSAVLSHELGHNLGAAHARGDAGATGTKDGSYGYSYGYRFTVTDSSGQSRQLRTIMAYSPGTRLGYFSNPRIRLPMADFPGGTLTFPSSPALGVVEGSEAAADNARTIEENAFQVAGFRQALDGSAAGRLINVSTRALVGAAERQMIGGFVLGGVGPKTVLVRAVGPALGLPPINLTGVLPDPSLQLVDSATGTVIASNLDWGLPASSAVSLANAARDAGAFSLPVGSADAALKISLLPGAYTAVVSGTGGTGLALVEAYAVEAGGSKPLNLSTRAYGSVEQPIVAGFVVREDPAFPGRTKRIFIRALGPSLRNFGIPDAQIMGDPMLQLYSSSGALLLENDDWDPPSTVFGQNIRPTTRGVVDQYGEQVVFAAITRLNTGSMQPTEPGIVVDLLPGAYTVNIQPFVNLPSQPAVSGVAIVEVYELSED